MAAQQQLVTETKVGQDWHLGGVCPGGPHGVAPVPIVARRDDACRGHEPKVRAEVTSGAKRRDRRGGCCSAGVTCIAAGAYGDRLSSGRPGAGSGSCMWAGVLLLAEDDPIEPGVAIWALSAGVG